MYTRFARAVMILWFRRRRRRRRQPNNGAAWMMESLYACTARDRPRACDSFGYQACGLAGGLHDWNGPVEVSDNVRCSRQFLVRAAVGRR